MINQVEYILNKNFIYCRQLAYHSEHASSHLNTGVDLHLAWISLATAWELLVQLAWIRLLIMLSGEWTMSNLLAKVC